MFILCARRRKSRKGALTATLAVRKIGKTRKTIMGRKLVPRRVIMLLVAGVLILPITLGVVLGVSTLMVAMGDSTGGQVLRYIAWGCGIAWAVDLICLILAQGLNSLTDTDEQYGGAGDWGLGIGAGDWGLGLGIGSWGLGVGNWRIQIPNPKSPTPGPAALAGRAVAC